MKKVIAAIIIAASIYMVTVISPYEKFSGTTIHLAGDSTMAKKIESKRPNTGWGEAFTSMLCDDVRLSNHAKNGRSSKSFLSENRWKKLLEQLKIGDIVMIQFGHNDQKISQPDLYASPWQDYKNNLQRFVSDVRALEAEPVLLTSIVRRAFDSQGKLKQTLGDYPAATRAVADQMKVALIDLNVATRAIVETLGPDTSKKFYLHLPPGIHKNYVDGKEDDTHLNPEGAFEIAAIVAAELKETHPDLVCF